MKLIQLSFLTLIALSIFSCKKDKDEVAKTALQKYVDENSSLTQVSLDAFGAGNNTEFQGNTEFPIAVYFLKVVGSNDIQIFESFYADSSNYGRYSRKFQSSESVFNGKMGKFLLTSTNTSKWIIVTYKTTTNLYISTPIRISSFDHPTVDISDSLTITESGITPHFNWTNDDITGCSKYFSAISDGTNNLISAIYTSEKNWTFFDASSVILDFSPTAPSLSPNMTYTYTHFGIDSHLWARSIGARNFQTN